MTTEKAKRGDLIVIEERTDYGTSEPTFTLERVTSVTRDGIPKRTAAVRRNRDPDLPDWPDGESDLFHVQTSRGRKYRRFRVYYQTHWLVPAADVDAEGLWSAWRARSEGSWRPEPFTSLEDARAFVAGFKR
jgi:hypothetical protein